MQRGAMHEVRWVRPPRVDRGGRPEEPVEGVGRAIEAFGLPAPPEPMSVLNEAVFFLKTGAEIEHALLVQYLYAAYSLDETADPQVQAWQGKIAQIAKEEMGHLVTVENLLLALKAKPWLNRPSYPITSGFSPFPFRLEAASRHTLGKYVVAESPLDIPDNVKADFEVALKDAQLEDGAPLEVHKVGILYAYLYWLFQPDDKPTDPWHLPEIDRFPRGRHILNKDLETGAALVNRLAMATEFRAGGAIHVDPQRVAAATTPDDFRAKCLQAIARIVSQGEGQVPAIREPQPHFNRFLDIHKAFVKFTDQNPPPVREVPLNPSTSGTFTNASTLLWAVLSNKRYQMLLIELIHALTLPRVPRPPGTPAAGGAPAPAPAGRADLCRWSIDEMKQPIANIARQMMMMPRDTTTPFQPKKSSAGAPPFELDPAPLPEKDADLWQRQRDLINDSEQLLAQITAIAGGTLKPELADIVRWIKESDQQALAQIPKT